MKNNMSNNKKQSSKENQTYRNNNKINQNSLKWLFRFVRPYKIKWTFGNFFNAISGAGAQLLFAIGMGNMVDGMISRDSNALYNALTYVFAGFLFVIICDTLYKKLHFSAMAGIKASMRGTLFHKLVRRKMKIDKEEHTANNMTVLEQDVELAINIIGTEIQSLLAAICMLAVGVISIVIKDRGIGIFCIIMLLGNLVTHLTFGPKQEEKTKERQEELSKLNRVYSDLFSGAMVIKLSKLHDLMYGRIHEASHRVYSKKVEERNLTVMELLLSSLFEIFTAIMPVLFGAYKCILGEMTVGEVFFIAQLSGGIIRYSSDIGSIMIRIANGKAGVKRIHSIMDDQDETQYFGIQSGDNKTKDAIILQNVSAGYGDDYVVRDINIKVGKNETVAIVGGSGGGKSTIFKSILQFVPYEGSIKIFGIEAKDYALDSLRDTFAYVEQEARLFDGSIYDNISYGRDGSTVDEVFEAARNAFAEEFILNLPMGYDTIIGENGYKLSGGERQRLAIARAFLKDAPILLLDEATSALDSESEKMVQLALEKLMNGRTILIIAHRLSTIQNADKIVVVEGGMVLESGNHESLMNIKGRYQKLYESGGSIVASGNL